MINNIIATDILCAQRLDGKLHELILTMNNNLKDILMELPDNFLYTEDDISDTIIFGYIYREYSRRVEEYQVKAIKLNESGDVIIFLGDIDDECSLEDIANGKGGDWYPLFGGGDVLSWFTIIEINEKISNYLEKDEDL